MCVDRAVGEMWRLSTHLAEYSYPKRGGDLEDDISCLKTREVHADGFPLIVYLSRSEYPDQTLDTFQVLGQRTPFLPFFLVCKLARRYLGDTGLSYIEMYAENKKIYCWTRSTDAEGNVLTPQEDFVRCAYEGLEYAHMDPSKVNFF